jgi:FSR family fosmidomycin resistance protein-like MFS transporter
LTITARPGNSGAAMRTGPRIPFAFLSWAGHGVNDLYFFILPLVLPLLLQDFALSYRAAGLILALFLTVIAACSFLFGRISDRFSPWALIGGGFLLASLAFIGGGSMRGLPALLVFLAAGAVGTSTYHPVIYALIDRLTRERRGRVLGWFEFWGGLTILAMYLLVGLLLRYLGWRGVLFLVGAPGLVIGVVFLRRGMYEQRDSREQAGSLQASPRPPAPEGRTRTSLALAFFLASCALRFLSTTAVVNFLPTFLAQGRNLPPSVAAYISAFVFLGGTIPVVLFGTAADRFAPMRILLLASGLLSPLILLLGLRLPYWVVLPVLFAFGAMHSGCGPAQNLVLSRLGARLGRGAVFGILLGLLGLIGALSPALFGLLADHLGLDAAMKLFALPALAGWLVLLGFERIARAGRLLPSR